MSLTLMWKRHGKKFLMVFSEVFTVIRTQSNIYDGGFMRK